MVAPRRYRYRRWRSDLVFQKHDSLCSRCFDGNLDADDQGVPLRHPWQANGLSGALHDCYWLRRRWLAFVPFKQVRDRGQRTQPGSGNTPFILSPLRSSAFLVSLGTPTGNKVELPLVIHRTTFVPRQRQTAGTKNILAPQSWTLEHTNPTHGSNPGLKVI